MKELALNELKEIEFEILKMFHEFCVANDIRYYLSHGTLLGAVRYGKFIPWDDDVDVLVPREDYNKLIALFADNNRYKLYAYEKDNKFLFPYAKICDMTTIKEELNYDNGIKLGVDMDVFPLDAWENDYEKAKKESDKMKKYMFRLGLTKLDKPDSKNPFKRKVKGIYMRLCKRYGSEYFVKKIIGDAYKQELNNSSYLGSKAWNVYHYRDIMPAEIFSDTIEIEFEGQKFFAPKDYDAYLTKLYGDYMPEPPIEKQKTHHSFKAYRI